MKYSWPTMAGDAQRTGFRDLHFAPPLKQLSSVEGNTWGTGQPVLAGHILFSVRENPCADDLFDENYGWIRSDLTLEPNPALALWKTSLLVPTSEQVYLLDQLSGETQAIWPYGCLRNAPCVIQDHLFWHAVDHQLTAVDLVSRQLIWRQPFRTMECSPAADENAVYSANQHEIVAWELDSGKLLWRYPLVNSAPILYLSLRAGIVYCSLPKAQGVLALDARTGAPIWHSLQEKWLESPVCVDFERVYVTGFELYALDRFTGELLWVQPHPSGEPHSFLSPPICLGDTLYIAGGSAPRLYAFDSHTGKLLWQDDQFHALCSEPALFANDLLFFLSKNRPFRVYSPIDS